MNQENEGTNTKNENEITCFTDIRKTKCSAQFYASKFENLDKTGKF